MTTHQRPTHRTPMVRPLTAAEWADLAMRATGPEMDEAIAGDRARQRLDDEGERTETEREYERAERARIVRAETEPEPIGPEHPDTCVLRCARVCEGWHECDTCEAEQARAESESGDPIYAAAILNAPAPAVVRLPHCSPILGHSPACVRDGTYCGQDPSHAGPCKPHGAITYTPAPAEPQAKCSADRLLVTIRDYLWPAGDPDRQWSPDTIERVAYLMEQAGYGRPTE